MLRYSVGRGNGFLRLGTMNSAKQASHSSPPQRWIDSAGAAVAIETAPEH